MRLRRKPWGEELISSHPELVISYENLDSEILTKFLENNEIIIEIGSGKGDFIIEMAKKYPQYHFLAVEMQSMALAYIVKKLQDEKIDNILMINSDVTYLFEKLQGKKFKYIFLNFSDPWPKKRQQKRRLTYNTMLDQYSKIIEPDGKLIFKTDNELLFADSVEYLKESPFVALSVDYNYDGNDPFDAPTEYEKKFRELGTPIKRYIAELKK